MKALLLVLASFSLAEAYSPQYAELCSYDKMCSKIVGSDGRLKPVQPVLKKLMEAMSGDIIYWSEKYGVDPRAVAGAILTENTLNVGYVDRIQDTIVKYGVLDSDFLKTHKFSYGPGQINLKAALDADRYLARLGLRPARSEQDVANLLATAPGAAEYAAAIIRQAQDIYKKAGIDISKDPAALASLYNLGRYEKFASESRASGKPPRPNYFGFFVRENLASVEDSIGWSPTRGRFKRFDVAKTFSKEGDSGRLLQPLTLRGAPADCTSGTEGGDPIETARMTRSTWHEYPGVDIPKGSEVQIIGRGMDCKMRDWSLVQTHNGRMGWVEHSELESKTDPRSEKLGLTCRAPNKDCLRDALEKYDAKGLEGGDPSKGLHYLPIAKINDADPASWRKPNAREASGALIHDDDHELNCNAGVSEGSIPKDINFEFLKASLTDHKIDFEALTARAFPGTEVISSEKRDQLMQKVQQRLRDSSSRRRSLDDDDDDRRGNGSHFSRRDRDYQTRVDYNAKDPLGAFLRRSYEALRRCGEVDQCRVAKLTDFEAALNTKLEDIKSVAELKKFQDAALNFKPFTVTHPGDRKRDRESRHRYSVSPFGGALGSPGAPGMPDGSTSSDSVSDEGRKVDDDALRGFEAACGPVLSQLAETKEIYPKLLADIKKDRRDAPEDVMREMYTLREACRDVGMLRTYKAHGEKEWEKTGRSCSLSLSQSLGKVPFGVLANMNLTESDYAGLLEAALSKLKDELENTGLSALSTTTQEVDPKETAARRLASCNYDQEKMTDKIEALAQSGCVQSIIVGDHELMRGLSIPKGVSLVKQSQLPSDKIGVVFKNSCTSGGNTFLPRWFW